MNFRNFNSKESLELNEKIAKCPFVITIEERVLKRNIASAYHAKGPPESILHIFVSIEEELGVRTCQQL